MWITFCLSVQESAASTSDSPPDFELLAEALAPSAWWRGKHSVSRTWSARCKRGGWITALYGVEISQNSPWTACPGSIGTRVDTPASPFPPLAREVESLTLDTCGRPSSTTCNTCDHEDCSSRTSQVTCPSVFETSLETWSTWVTQLRSACTQRRRSALPTDESASSSSAWPTPDCTMRPHEGNVRLLRKGVEAGLDKAEADAMLGRDIGLPQGKLKAWKPTDSRHDQVVGKGPTSRPGQLNPYWVEMLMGFPTGWTDCGRWETPSCRSKPNTRSGDSGGC